jgi:hypothetical protein
MAASRDGWKGILAWGVGALGLVMFAGPAAAQPATAFDDLTVLLKAADRLQVERTSGAMAEGRLILVTGDELRLDSARGQLVVPRAEIRVVTVTKGRARKCAVIGFAAGAVFGAIALAGFSGETRAEDAIGGAMMMGSLFGAVGAGFGALSPSRTVVYRAPTDHARARVHLAPLIARGTKGLAVGLSF